MSPQETLDRYRHMAVVNSDRLAHELSYALRELPEDEQLRMMGHSRMAGDFWLFRDTTRTDGKGEFVLEVVYSAEHGDCITSVYANDSVNASLGNVIRMREDLVNAISERLGLSVDLIGVEDEGRGRQIDLREMSTAQLIDMLKDQFGKSIVTADNRGGNLSLMGRIFGRGRK